VVVLVLPLTIITVIPLNAVSIYDKVIDHIAKARLIAERDGKPECGCYVCTAYLLGSGELTNA
jgi:hypothetical protein